MPQRSINTAIGPVLLEAESDALARVRIGQIATEQTHDRLLDEAVAQLEAYFAGRLRCFDLPLAPAASARGQALRDAIVSIPHGATLSYGALARAAASGPRAIGQACRRNPFPLIVPCHRVVASGGLGNYSAGAGVATKQWLLAHEHGDAMMRI